MQGTGYSAEQTKWISNWEKNIDSTLKAIKKLREDLETNPKLTNSTTQKYHLYIRLLLAEIMETVDLYENLYNLEEKVKPSDLADSHE